jgi:hypothetical protein
MLITQVNNRFVVEVDGGRMHILNEKSLVWNLKHVFKWKKAEIKGLIAELSVVKRVKIG